MLHLVQGRPVDIEIEDEDEQQQEQQQQQQQQQQAHEQSTSPRIIRISTGNASGTESSGEGEELDGVPQRVELYKEFLRMQQRQQEKRAEDAAERNDGSRLVNAGGASQMEIPLLPRHGAGDLPSYAPASAGAVNFIPENFTLSSFAEREARKVKGDANLVRDLQQLLRQIKRDRSTRAFCASMNERHEESFRTFMRQRMPEQLKAFYRMVQLARRRRQVVRAFTHTGTSQRNSQTVPTHDSVPEFPPFGTSRAFDADIITPANPVNTVNVDSNDVLTMEEPSDTAVYNADSTAAALREASPEQPEPCAQGTDIDYADRSGAQNPVTAHAEPLKRGSSSEGFALESPTKRVRTEGIAQQQRPQRDSSEDLQEQPQRHQSLLSMLFPACRDSGLSFSHVPGVAASIPTAGNRDNDVVIVTSPLATAATAPIGSNEQESGRTDMEETSRVFEQAKEIVTRSFLNADPRFLIVFDAFGRPFSVKTGLQVPTAQKLLDKVMQDIRRGGVNSQDGYTVDPAKFE